MSTRKSIIGISCLSVLLSMPGIGIALDKKHSAETESKDVGKDAERALSAANVLLEITKTPEKGIPKELLDHADAIAVVPNITKAAFGVGGRHGKGVVAQRKADGSWGPPAFIEIDGGSFGPQMRVSLTDLILVFTNDDGLKGLFKDKLALSGDPGVAAGPVGRTAEAGTNLTFDSPIYSYSRSKGLFAGLSLKGSVMSIDDSANRRLYGNVPAKEIVLKGTNMPAPEVKPFVDALNQVAPKETHKRG